MIFQNCFKFSGSVDHVNRKLKKRMMLALELLHILNQQVTELVKESMCAVT